jgi:undecaprenyl-diphosphatase
VSALRADFEPQARRYQIKAPTRCEGVCFPPPTCQYLRLIGMANIFQILILAVIQGACELLPVSSSAHVIVAEKLMGLDPSSPEMTMLLVVLHTGTMGAVILYFWRDWKRNYFSVPGKLGPFAKQIVVATLCTGVVGYGLQKLIEKVFMRGVPHAEIESLFSNLPLMAGALAAVGILIIYAGMHEGKAVRNVEIETRQSCWIGVVQGLCLPFRGFSRSGSTISTGLLLGLPKQKVEEFSFALAVVLTPVVIVREAWRLIKSQALAAAGPDVHLTTAQIAHEGLRFVQNALDPDGPSGSFLVPGLTGLVVSFVAGLLALLWLANWLEGGQWKIFGYYCLVAAAAVLGVHFLVH